MIFKYRIFTLLLVVPVFLSGWGFNEHKTIAAIAWEELTPETREKVMDLLAVSGDTSMIESSTWADDIKPEDRYSYTFTFHYINIPADAIMYDRGRDCSGDSCIVEVIPGYISTLADGNAPDSLRNEALKFLIHFVADIHQPMHTGLPEDRGGNDVKLVYRSRTVNLHALWDYEINIDRIADFSDYARQLHTRGKTMDLSAVLTVEDPVDWTNESFRIGREFAYTVSDGDTVSQDYEQQAIEYIDYRIMVGGFRLARLLNEIFSR